MDYCGTLDNVRTMLKTKYWGAKMINNVIRQQGEHMLWDTSECESDCEILYSWFQNSYFQTNL